MSALVSPISRNPRSRIARLVQMLVERQRHAVEVERLAALDDYREHLPLDHPYRHMLDVPVDVACARMVCASEDSCSCETPGGAA
jgi:hypothetical protein